MRARRLASRERRQLLIEDDLMLAGEAMTGRPTVEAIEPSGGSADVGRRPTLSVRLGDLVQFG